MSRAPKFTLVAIGILCSSVGFAREAESFKQWASGPVRYIAQKDELKTYKRLKSDGERALYVEKFWIRRDPTPETLTNEYRELFWERVREANTNFLDSHRPGWTTDRGKIHILYGAPTQIEEDLHLATGAGSTAGKGVIRWIYEGRPEQRHDLDAITVVAFVRQASGGFRVSYDPKLTSVFFDALAIRENRYRAMDRFIQIHGAPVRSELSVMLDLGKMQEVPPAAQVLLESVETVESFQTTDIDVDVSRFEPPDESGVLVVVTVDVSHVSAADIPAIVGRFAFAERPDLKPEILGEDSFKLTVGGGRRFAQGRIVVEPGSYELTLLVVDPATAETGVYRQTVLALPGSDRLRLSDVVQAEELDSLPYASLASHSEPFLLGPFRVIPRPDSIYHRGDTIRVFYEIYGGQPPYRVTYGLEGQDNDGSWVALGSPSTAEQTGGAQAWELTSSSAWPLGDYRIWISIADDTGGNTSAQSHFALADQVIAAQE